MFSVETLLSSLTTARRVQNGFKLIKEANKEGGLTSETEHKIMAETTKKPSYLSRKVIYTVGGFLFFIANSKFDRGFSTNEAMAVLGFLGFGTAAQAAVDLRK